MGIQKFLPHLSLFIYFYVSNFISWCTVGSRLQLSKQRRQGFMSHCLKRHTAETAEMIVFPITLLYYA